MENGRAKSAGVTALFSAVCGWAKGRWRGRGKKQIPCSGVPKRVDGVTVLLENEAVALSVF